MPGQAVRIRHFSDAAHGRAATPTGAPSTTPAREQKTRQKKQSKHITNIIYNSYACSSYVFSAQSLNNFLNLASLIGPRNCGAKLLYAFNALEDEQISKFMRTRVIKPIMSCILLMILEALAVTLLISGR